MYMQKIKKNSGLASALPESESDPCWDLEGEILGSLDSGTSHVRILWPVKLIHRRRDYVWHFLKKDHSTQESELFVPNVPHVTH